MTGAEVAAVAFEIALLLAGLWLAWRLVLRPGAPAKGGSRLPEWRIPAVDFVLFLFAGIAGALTLAGMAGSVLQRVHIGTDAATVVASAGQEGGFLLGLALFTFLYGGPGPEGAARTGAAFALKSGTATFLVAMPLVTGVNFLWDRFLVGTGLPDEQQKLVDILENTRSAALRWSFVAVATLLVPVAEEVLFRGGLFRYLRTRVPRWVAIASTSVLFGALHVQWSGQMSGLPSLLPLVVLAAVFCVAYERTGTILTPIIAHALFNLNMMVLVIAGMAQ
jgi:membrane protease YdiL (CAAX protease family)